MLCNSYNSKILYEEFHWIYLRGDIKLLLVTVNNRLIVEIEIVHDLSCHPISSDKVYTKVCIRLGDGLECNVDKRLGPTFNCCFSVLWKLVICPVIDVSLIVHLSVSVCLSVSLHCFCFYLSVFANKECVSERERERERESNLYWHICDTK